MAEETEPDVIEAPPADECASPSSECVDSIVSRLISGTATLDSVPIGRHAELIDRLQVAKTESLVARNFDRAQRCHDLIALLRPSKIAAAPHPRGFSSLSHTWQPLRLPLITAGGASEAKLEAELATSQRFWDMEYVRMSEIRDEETRALANQQRAEFCRLRRPPPPPDPVDLPAARLLRERGAAEGNGGMCMRAAVLNAMETEYRRWRAKCAVREKVARLRADQAEERADLARAWERRLESLRGQMRAEVDGKRQQFPNTRRMRRTCPILHQPLSVASG